MRTLPRHTSYKCVTQTDLIALQNDPSTPRLGRKDLVAIVGLNAHQALSNSAWLSQFAVNPKYSDTHMADDLIAFVVQFCIARSYDSLEIVTTECQFKDRETFIKLGFVIYIMKNLQDARCSY